jgi:hypothetical protein
VPKINFENTKLEDVVEFLGDVTQCTVRANWRAMEEVGIMKNTPVDTRLSNVTLRTALDILLADVSGPVARNDRLGWVQWNGVLTISTNADLDRSTYIEVYEIRDLLAHEFAEAVLERGNPIRDLLGIWNEDETIFGRGDDDSDDVLGSGGCSDVGGSEEDWRKAADDLIVVLEKTIDPESWIAGSPTSGHISFLAGVLIINQTPQNHERIAELLARFRKSLLGKPAEEGKQ